MDEDGNCTECLVASLPSVIVLLSDQQMSLVMGDMKAVSSSDQKRLVTASLFVSGLGERQLNARSFTANDHTSAKTCTCVANCWKIGASQLELPVLKFFQEHGSRLRTSVHIFTRTCSCIYVDICSYVNAQVLGLQWNRETLCVSHNMASQWCL